MKTYRITAVKPVGFPVLLVTFEDGLSGEIDLSADLTPSSIFAPLADRSLFDQVSIAPGGRSLGWNLDALGHEIDLGADSLRIDIETNHVHQLAERYRLQRTAAE